MSIYIAGRINVDIFIEVDNVLVRGRKYRGRVVLTDVGGTAANIATSIARVNRDLRPKLLGAIGRDYAEFVYEKLGLEGIDLQYLKILGEDTGKAYIFLEPDGETTIITVPGANDRYNEIHTPSRIDDAEALAICNTTYPVALKLLDLANDAGIPIFIDPHSLWLELVERIRRINGVCFYLPNEYELNSYANVDVDATHSIIRYAEDIGCSIVVKRGEKGAVVVHEGKAIKISAIPLDVLGFKVLSTAGCGDTFTGVFIAMYLRTRDVVEALKYATIAAGIKATRISSRASPSIDELLGVAEVVKRRNLIDVRVMEV